MTAPLDTRPALSILIVEDENQVKEFLCLLIAKRFPGSTIHQAENGEQGVELFQEHRPDIVITDLSMPVMDGIEMAGKIRALDPGAFIIATTARSDTRYLLDAIKTGINRYVLKPIEIATLLEYIEDCQARIISSRRIKAQQEHIRMLSLAVEQSTNMIIIADARGNVEYLNPMFTGITGFDQEEVVGQSLRVLMAGATPVDSYEILRSAISRGFEWRGEFMHRKKDGGLLCVEASVSTVATEEGYAARIVAVLQDISERKQAEKNLLQLNDKLEQCVIERTAELETANRGLETANRGLETANRELTTINKELEAFCYSVSHDLRAPLRAMDGFSKILQADYSGQLDETGKGCLSRIGSAAVSMGQLIDDLLELSLVTRRPLRCEKINLSDLAKEQALTLIELESQRRVEFAIPEGIEAYGDPNLIRMALSNLLGNAWKYTGKERCPRIEFGTSLADGDTVYFVRDNGVGFDQAHVSHLFKAFQRLHKNGEFAGNGIGLATVERIIQRHGGRIWAEAETGKGATFYFTLG